MAERRLVLVEWVDSVGAGRDWADLKDVVADAGLPVCRSVGWLLEENAEALIVVPHVLRYVDGAESGCGEMEIPRGCVRRCVDLKGVSDL